MSARTADCGGAAVNQMPRATGRGVRGEPGLGCWWQGACLTQASGHEGMFGRPRVLRARVGGRCPGRTELGEGARQQEREERGGGQGGGLFDDVTGEGLSDSGGQGGHQERKHGGPARPGSKEIGDFGGNGGTTVQEDQPGVRLDGRERCWPFGQALGRLLWAACLHRAALLWAALLRAACSAAGGLAQREAKQVGAH